MTEISVIDNTIAILNSKIQEIENEKTKLLDGDVNQRDIDILDGFIVELEKQIIVEKRRRSDMFKLREYQTLCDHIFVEDLVDIDPDRSISIEYCVHCLVTK